MACRECGCFTLFKDVCDSCIRASSALSDLSGFLPSEDPDKRIQPQNEQLDSGQRKPNKYHSDQQHTSSHLGVVINDTKISDFENERLIAQAKRTQAEHNPPQQISQKQKPQEVSALAAKLGIDLSELHGVFDINEINSEIQNTQKPKPVVLIDCSNCGHKVKKNTTCVYCGN